MRIFAFLLPILFSLTVDANSDCNSRLSYRLLQRQTYLLFLRAGLTEELARTLELKIKFQDEPEEIGQLFEVLNKNLHHLSKLTDSEQANLTQIYIERDLNMLSSNLPLRLDGGPIRRIVMNQKRLLTFLNTKYTNPDLAAELMTMVARIQIILNPSLTLDSMGNYKSENLMSWVDQGDPRLLPIYERMLELFSRRVSLRQGVDNYLLNIDTMSKFVFLWEHMFKLRRLYEDPSGLPKINLASIKLLENWVEIYTSSLHRSAIDRALDRFIAQIGVDLIASEAMFIGLEDTNKLFITNLLERFEKFAEGVIANTKKIGSL